jgi:3-methylcrotonyl-CoA carboxylase alpha subunit
MSTAKRMGIRTVAVYSDADAGARHVALADEAVRIGPAPARESYLRGDLIITAARTTGADAVHPGYGFLSENESFAQALADVDITFIGPPPFAIHAMGSKSEAKTLMGRARVPLVPGYHGDQQDPAFLRREADAIGYPVLIKASAGGGGKGMRVVSRSSDFVGALESCQREAKASFGDDRVLVEKYLERPRHIEIQVFADGLGNAVYLFERDCSVQRRHQKIIEEAPAPGMNDARRRAMGEAAVAAARAVGYVGAGTVEFIAEPSGEFYFMEMNTRLQVEHPVTEMITGLDLVEWQLRVAAGEPLPLAQDDLAIRGHAIEARVYAEDPARDFLPQTGRLAHLRFPADAADLRTDTGVEAGASITPYYDPMIAKLIAWGADRRAALARLASALDEVEIAGLRTNVEFLARTVRCRAFAAAELDTGLIERSRAELFPPRPALADEFLAAAAYAEMLAEQGAARERSAASGDPHSPWHRVDGWRLNQDSHHDLAFAEGEARYAVTVHFQGTDTRLGIAGRDFALEGERLADGRLLVRLDGRAFKARAVRDGRDWHIFIDGTQRRLTLHEELEGLDIDAGGGSLAAPMPGKVIAVMVKRGDKVQKGAPLLILEAMKMEHTVFAPGDGEVKEIHYAAGEQVAEGAELLRLE